MDLCIFVSKYLLKRRTVFYRDLDSSSVPPMLKEATPLVVVNVLKEKYSEFQVRDWLVAIIGESKAAIQIKRYSGLSEKWLLFICLDSTKPVGCQWVRLINDKIFNDCILHTGEEVLTTGAFVVESHRGRSIHKLMQEASFREIVNLFGVKRVMAVVENLNISSIKTREKIDEKIYYNNYLVKAIGINLLSICIRKDGKIFIWVVPFMKFFFPKM